MTPSSKAPRMREMPSGREPLEELVREGSFAR
jgi:hypothetical protein